MKNFLNKLTDLLFPPDIKCLVCGCELDGENSVNGFCNSCYAKMQFIVNPCAICGDTMHNENIICVNCKNRKTTYFYNNTSVFEYSGIIKNLIVSAKFDGKRYLAKSMAKFMADSFNFNKFKCDIITFVASGTKRTKQRGYNLSELIATEFAKLVNLPTLATLVRVKESEQKDKTFSERQKNISGAFETAPNLNLKGKNVLLIDDVYTTGATMNECARVLKLAGANEVFGLTFAHTPKIYNK